MKVSVIGLGYIGLPTATLIASRNIDVIGIDINQDIVDSLNCGNTHFHEPDLDKLVASTVSSGKLRASSKAEPSDIFVITVPTPINHDKTCDASYVFSAVELIAPVLQPSNLVILESTSPVGLTEKCVDLLSSLRKDLKFPTYQDNSIIEDVHVAYSPERVLPGKILSELVKNNRVIGGVTDLSAQKALEFYSIFVQGECIKTNSRTAELCKLTENSFRDVNIAFANELSLICDQKNIDVWELISLANHHPRVNILSPGPGVGGHCIAVDPWFIVEDAQDNANLIKQARLINDNKPDFVIDKVKQMVDLMDQDISEINISTMGIAFKPDVDDLRESPAIEIAHRINKMGFKNQFISEPNIEMLPKILVEDNCSLSSFKEAIEYADIILILVKHKQFMALEKLNLEKKNIIDIIGIMRVH